MIPEPGNPQSLNRYSWVLNQPLRFTDPTGHFEQDALQEATGLDDKAFAEWWASLPPELQNLLTDAQWSSILLFDETILGESVHFELLFGKDKETDKMAFFNLVDGKKMNFWEGISHSRTALEETGVRPDLIRWDSPRPPLQQHADFFEGDDVFLAFDDEYQRAYDSTMSCAVGIGISLAGLISLKKPTLIGGGSAAFGAAWSALTCVLSLSNDPVPYIWNGPVENWRWVPANSFTNSQHVWQNVH